MPSVPNRILLAAAVALLPGATVLPASAVADPLKIGFVSTLSGPSAPLGVHMRDGFQLAVKELGGKLGGQPVEVIVVDDELKPDVAVTKVRALLDRDKVDLVAGVVFSNVMMAIQKPVLESETFLISGNAGPSPLAGKGCSPFFFSASYQNDQNHEVMGKYAQDKGYKRVVLMTPNYQAGKDSMAGFKRHFKGEVVEEIFTQLGQLDFSAELAKIAAANPDALFTFMPGGMGVNLTKQFAQAGLAGKVPFLSAFTVDETTLPATQDAAVGLLSGAEWAPSIDTPENKAFVAAYEKEYGVVPSLYAAQGYDAAKLIDGALRQAGGKVSDKQAFRKALAAAPFKSVRGTFAFNTNGFPIQDFYVVKAVKRPDGKFATAVETKVFEKAKDAYAGDCKLK
ncbi:ABC transporter substrate-binding protein [Rhodoplanes sp. TEM]|uniref:ABC transporter substrate-binding protein n=1 Tax=Rhodoplanes tepidamans TaxID=200616 RepID=A0ABT5J501_RHOTP|nr:MULTISPECIES: ABC transporter substrate-binding protein [Rhodoplanes]MDC7784709.1 ABC transporter substrate-binding protein [Rhodoplanes tepidamans]MDC7982176.1 ABC transporter substrate-binding protein [Rhodoplanes sp. TEM]MDQ0356180.1 branched-chain amino acid transport system substrate-binding protein [Rhodoplanes tepidamans]